MHMFYQPVLILQVTIVGVRKSGNEDISYLAQVKTARVPVLSNKDRHCQEFRDSRTDFSRIKVIIIGMFLLCYCYDIYNIMHPILFVYIHNMYIPQSTSGFSMCPLFTHQLYYQEFTFTTCTGEIH